MGLTMPVLLDPSAQVYQDYFIAAPDAAAPYPREFIIDANGNVAYTASDVDIDAMAAVLDELLE